VYNWLQAVFGLYNMIPIPTPSPTSFQLKPFFSDSITENFRSYLLPTYLANNILRTDWWRIRFRTSL